MFEGVFVSCVWGLCLRSGFKVPSAAVFGDSLTVENAVPALPSLSACDGGLVFSRKTEIRHTVKAAGIREDKGSAGVTNLRQNSKKRC